MLTSNYFILIDLVNGINKTLKNKKVVKYVKTDTFKYVKIKKLEMRIKCLKITQ